MPCNLPVGELNNKAVEVHKVSLFYTQLTSLYDPGKEVKSPDMIVTLCQ